MRLAAAGQREVLQTHRGVLGVEVNAFVEALHRLLHLAAGRAAAAAGRQDGEATFEAPVRRDDPPQELVVNDPKGVFDAWQRLSDCFRKPPAFGEVIAPEIHLKEDIKAELGAEDLDMPDSLCGIR